MLIGEKADADTATQTDRDQQQSDDKNKILSASNELTRHSRTGSKLTCKSHFFAHMKQWEGSLKRLTSVREKMLRTLSRLVNLTKSVSTHTVYNIQDDDNDNTTAKATVAFYMLSLLVVFTS